MNRGTPRNGMYSRARTTARGRRDLAPPPGRRAPASLNSEAWSRASASRSRAASLRARRRSLPTSCRSSDSVRSTTWRLTTAVGARASHPRAVDRGTPRCVAMRRSPVRWTRSRSRWSERCCGPRVVGMRRIIRYSADCRRKGLRTSSVPATTRAGTYRMSMGTAKMYARLHRTIMQLWNAEMPAGLDSLPTDGRSAAMHQRPGAARGPCASGGHSSYCTNAQMTVTRMYVPRGALTFRTMTLYALSLVSSRASET
jgi:hypothetical protein